MSEPQTTIREAYERWEQQTLWPALDRAPERDVPFTTTSSAPIERLYTPLDLAENDYQRDIAHPGEYPFTRGVHPTGYRGKLWTMRHVRRLRHRRGDQRSASSTSSSTARPASRSPSTCRRSMAATPTTRWSHGEVGRCGVAIDIARRHGGPASTASPLDDVTTSMTINSHGGDDLRHVPGRWPSSAASTREQAARHAPERHPQGVHRPEGVDLPARPVDAPDGATPIAFGAEHMPQLEPDLGLAATTSARRARTAAQELAFTLRRRHRLCRGRRSPAAWTSTSSRRGSRFFFNAHNDFFEEIAKYPRRARIWARTMREHYGAQNPRSWWLRFHAQTAGCSLTAQQPEVNIIAHQHPGAGGVLGGTQSLHTNSMDEALALPSEEAVTIALRTQQVIAEESGVANTVDPLGGSYFVEALTDRMERECLEYFRQIAEQGGVIPAIRNGYFQREIADAAYRYQREIDAGQRGIVGVNKHIVDAPLEIPILEMDRDGEAHHLRRLNHVRATRDNELVARRLAELRLAAEGDANLMPPILDCVRAYATLGEMCDVLREVFGVYQGDGGASRGFSSKH